MLHEIRPARQVAGEGFRRWFTDADFDLIVWFKDKSEKQVDGFQLCYDKQGNERALTWTRKGGVTHSRVDEGESPYAAKMSPVLLADGAFDASRILSDFRNASAEVEPRLVDLVVSALSA